MKRRRLPWGLLPAATLNLLFLFLPTVLMVLLSFWSMNDLEVVREWTLENYAAIYRDPLSLKIFGRTLWMSALISAVVILYAYPFAYFLVRYTRRWQQLLLMMVVITFWTSSVLRAYAWVAILGERGALNELLAFLGLVSHPLGIFLYNKFAVLIVGVYFLSPFAVLILYSSLERMDARLIAAAKDLGATPSQSFLHITIPQTLSGIYTAAFFCFINSLGFYIVPALVGGPNSVMMANLVGNLFNSGQLPPGAALSLAIALIVLVMLRIAWRYARLEDHYGT